MRRSHHIDHRGSSYDRRRRRKRMWRQLRIMVGRYASVIHTGRLSGKVRFMPIYRIPCHWCGEYLHRSRWVCDRLDPTSTYRRCNVVPACWSCNNLRSAGNVLVPYSLVVYAMMEV